MPRIRGLHPPRFLPVAPAVLAVLAAAACEPSRPGPDAVAVRDSAGLRLIEHPPGHAPPVWRLRDAPRLRHGNEPGHYSFSQVRDGAILASGRLAVADIQNSEVVLIGPGADDHVVVARQGSGPGEVRMALTLLPSGGERYLVEDDGNGKFLRFVGDSLLTVHTLGANRDLTYGIRAVGTNSDGDVVASTSSYMPVSEGPWVNGWVVVLPLDTTEPDTLFYFAMAPPFPEGDRNNPFGPFGHVAASNSQIMYGRSDRPEIFWYDHAGELKMISRWHQNPGRPTQRELDDFMESMASNLRRMNPRLSGSALDDFIESQLARYDLNEDLVLPLFNEFFVGGDGAMWVPEYSPAAFRSGSSRFRVFTEEGEWVATVEAPSPLRVLDVREGEVLGVVTDQFGVESVAVLELVVEG